MTTENQSKLQKMLGSFKQGTACLSSWLKDAGISNDLQAYYRRSGWLQPIGRGAFKRPNDTVGWQGALHALQTQGNMPIHAGALTALAMQGISHYIRFSHAPVFLFSAPKTKLPAWFKNHDWGSKINNFTTSIFPNDLGMVELEEKTFTIRVSCPERAIMEYLHLAPHRFDLEEGFQLMELLDAARPRLIQSLLEQCRSIKVKRLFLYMAKKAYNPWLEMLDISKLDLGTGSRTIGESRYNERIYNRELAITVPIELHEL